MYIVIGGLLAMSLMSTTHIKKADIMQHLIRVEGASVNVIVEEDVKSLYHNHIDRLMTDISKNHMDLNDLLINKNELIDKVQNVMELNAQSKKHLTEEQIEMFVEFTNRYSDEKEKLQDRLEMVFESTYLNSVQQDVLNNDIDYDLIIAKLRNLIYNQDEAIEMLQDLVRLGEDTLNTLRE